MRIAVCVTVVLTVAAGLLAQSPRGEVRFEVTSVKLNRSGDKFGGTRFLPDRYEATNIVLKAVLMDAYGLSAYQLAGEPAWAATDRFDIRATAGRVTSRTEMQAMLQALLAERFKLRVRPETRTVPGWNLLMSRSDGRLGPSLRRCESDCTGAAMIGGDTWTVNGGEIAAVTSIVQARLQAPVSDKTALSGKFTFSVRWSVPDELADAPGADVQAFLGAVQEQLGLKVESARVPVLVTVVESIERPTPD